jgi:hypothetical protein
MTRPFIIPAPHREQCHERSQMRRDTTTLLWPDESVYERIGESPTGLFAAANGWSTGWYDCSREEYEQAASCGCHAKNLYT